MLRELGYEIVQTKNENDYLKAENETLRVKVAKYKAFFFGNGELGKKLQKQLEENRDSLVGVFDGFCYASWRARAVFRTLEDMLYDGIITESEYSFCNERC